MPDLQTIIERYQVDVRRAIDGSALTYWRLLLASERAPGVLILDNLESTVQLTQLVSLPARPIVIATCRRAEQVPAGWQTINVGSMSLDEATSMVEKLLPDLSEADARALATEFAVYPLIVDYACRLLKYSSAPVKDFCRDLRVNIEETARDVRVGNVNATLNVILQKLLIHLESENRDSLTLARMIANTGYAGCLEGRFLS